MEGSSLLLLKNNRTENSWGEHLEATQFLMKSVSNPDWDFGLNALWRREVQTGRILHVSGGGHWRDTRSWKHWGDNVLICSQGTVLFPLMGIWDTTSRATSYVCGVLEGSRTVIGPAALDINTASGFGTMPQSQRAWCLGPRGRTRLVGTWMGYQPITGHSPSLISG